MTKKKLKKLVFEDHRPDSNNSRDVFRHYMADIIYGANDGIITTFAIVSGVHGAQLTPLVVIILGFANLLADGVSMGASNYLSIRVGAEAEGTTRGLLEPLSHAFTTFAAFVLCGAIPLIGFLIPGFLAHQFLVSSIMTGIALFVVGASRVFITRTNWLRGGLEMLGIGGVAALIAYGVGYILGQAINLG